MISYLKSLEGDVEQQKSNEIDACKEELRMYKQKNYGKKLLTIEYKRLSAISNEKIQLYNTDLERRKFNLSMLKRYKEIHYRQFNRIFDIYDFLLMNDGNDLKQLRNDQLAAKKLAKQQEALRFEEKNKALWNEYQNLGIVKELQTCKRQSDDKCKELDNLKLELSNFTDTLRKQEHDHELFCIEFVKNLTLSSYELSDLEEHVVTLRQSYQEVKNSNAMLKNRNDLMLIKIQQIIHESEKKESAQDDSFKLIPQTIKHFTMKGAQFKKPEIMPVLKELPDSSQASSVTDKTDSVDLPTRSTRNKAMNDKAMLKTNDDLMAVHVQQIMDESEKRESAQGESFTLIPQTIKHFTKKRAPLKKPEIMPVLKELPDSSQASSVTDKTDSVDLPTCSTRNKVKNNKAMLKTNDDLMAVHVQQIIDESEKRESAQGESLTSIPQTTKHFTKKRAPLKKPEIMPVLKELPDSSQAPSVTDKTDLVDLPTCSTRNKVKNNKAMLKTNDDLMAVHVQQIIDESEKRESAQGESLTSIPQTTKHFTKKRAPLKKPEIIPVLKELPDSSQAPSVTDKTDSVDLPTRSTRNKAKNNKAMLKTNDDLMAVHVQQIMDESKKRESAQGESLTSIPQTTKHFTKKRAPLKKQEYMPALKELPDSSQTSSVTNKADFVHRAMCTKRKNNKTLSSPNKTIKFTGTYSKSAKEGSPIVAESGRLVENPPCLPQSIVSTVQQTENDPIELDDFEFSEAFSHDMPTNLSGITENHSEHDLYEQEEQTANSIDIGSFSFSIGESELMSTLF